MKSIAVVCGASTGNNPVYVEAAASFGKLLAQHNIRLIFGGGKVGLMGAIADAVLTSGGQAIGVIPKGLVAREVAHTGLTEMHAVETMHERKALMAELADGFVALPGGFGTFDEICEILTWNQLGIISKPCAFLNVNHFYNQLLQMFRTCAEEGFIKAERLDTIILEEDGAALINKMRAYQPLPTTKWMSLKQV